MPNFGKFLSNQLNQFKPEVTSGLYKFPSEKDSYVKTEYSAWAGMRDTASVAERVIRGREIVDPEVTWGVDVGDRKLTSALHIHDKIQAVAKSKFSSSGSRLALVPFIGDKFKETRNNIEYCHRKSNIDGLVDRFEIRVIGDYKAQCTIVGIQSGGFFACVKAMCYRLFTQLDLAFNNVKPKDWYSILD